MNLHSILTLPARLAILPARIAVHVWATVESHLGPAGNPTDITDGDEYWLYWVYPEQRIPACPHTGTPCAQQNQL